MTLVVDTSVAIKWAVEEPDSSKAIELAPRALVAPDLFQAETGNALTKKVRLRQLSPEQATAAFQRILARVFLLPSTPYGSTAFELSLMLSHAIYDCYFLAAAMEQGCLVTADTVFTAKVRATRYAGLVYLLGEDIPQ